MDLFISPGTGGLITSDSDSVLILTYIRLGQFCFNVKDSVPHDITLRNLPLLIHDGIHTTGVKNILTYLREQNFNLDYDLTDFFSAEMTIALIEEQLTPAVDWILWADDFMFRKFTRPAYTRRLWWPWSFIYSLCWRYSQVNRLKHRHLALCANPDSPAGVQGWLMSSAIFALTLLSFVLGDNQYLAENKPTAVDAYLFARLWPLLLYESRHGQADWPSLSPGTSWQNQSASHPLIMHLMLCPNLLAHFSRIQQQHFPETVRFFQKERGSALFDRMLDRLVNRPFRKFLLFTFLVVSMFSLITITFTRMQVPQL